MPLIKSKVIAGDIDRVISCADDAQGELHICEIIVPDVIEWPFHCVHCTAHQGYETQPASCMLGFSIRKASAMHTSKRNESSLVL